jgi:hypothetical protein
MAKKRFSMPKTIAHLASMCRQAQAPFVLALVVLSLVACKQFTPPGPNAIGGSVNQTSYLLLDWPEGLRILIWDDIFGGEHHNHTESATNDPVFHQSGGAHSIDGRTYEYSLETRDGRQAEFTIDGIPCDLNTGRAFLINTIGSAIQVKQLNLDLSSLSPTNAGVEDFGRQTAEIARFTQSITNVAAKEDCSLTNVGSEPPTETTLAANPLPRSLKGYVIQSYCWERQWFFTLTVGRNSVNPCDSSEPVTTDNVTSYTLRGVEALKEALDQLQPGEHVTWCSSDLPDADVIDDLLAYSQRSGLELSVWTDPKPSPTATALQPASADRTPTADPGQRPDMHMTTSAVMSDNSLWYAFDKFDDAGGSYPYNQNQGLYRLQDGLITHFDIPATIRVLEAAPDGHLYMGAGCGVMRFKDESWQTLLDLTCSHRTSVTKLRPLDIAFADDGTVWVGGAHSLARYSNGSWAEFDIPAARVVVAADGTIWTRGWDGWANSDCCLTHISGSQTITYTYTGDVPVEPEVLNALLDRPGW